MARLYTLVALETAHIQQYIFNSNRLKENVGASFLVEVATDTWAREVVRTLTRSHNLRANGEFDRERRIEDDPTLAVEVLYAGGGNFVALFQSSDLAKDFARVLTGRVIREAPGLHLVLHSAKFNWDDTTTPLSTAVRNVLRGLKSARGHQPLNIGLAGLGVTVMCHSTSMPAATLRQYEEDDTPGLYSAEIVAKQQMFKAANDNLRDKLGLRDEYDFPLDLDQLGRTEGDKSFVAVVHADGNNVGRIIGSIGKVFDKPVVDNRPYIEAMRDFSENIKTATESALHDMMAELQTWCDWVLSLPEEKRPVDIWIDYDNQRPVLPFRPLVSGGDDVNFICDGRIGLALVASYLEKFGKYATELAVWGLPASVREYVDKKTGQRPVPETLAACAGIAIVKTHYPFARAYELAEELASNAKKMVRTRQKHDNDNTQYAALDWHVAMTGIYGDLDEIRQREYIIPVRTKDKATGQININNWSLTLRPLYLAADAHPYFTWDTVAALIDHFQNDEGWRDRRSKAKGLMQALRGRRTETRVFEARYLKNVGLSLPNPLGESFEVFRQHYGWHENYCGYYDTLELVDLFVSISPEKELA